MKTEETALETASVIRDPRTTLCNCKRAMYLMQMPYVHCPSCHATYRAKRLTYPVRCGRCQFNLFAWRLRNCIAEVPADFS